MNVREIILNKLPLYYLENDSYKDESGKGLLTRFLGMLGVELQENLVDPLHNLINELDPTTATEKFLGLLAYTVGNPIDLGGTAEDFRLRVTQALSLYKVAGTSRSYHLFFSLLGYRIRLRPHYPSVNNYDEGLYYDDFDESVQGTFQYDQDECAEYCVPYDIIIYVEPGDNSLTPEVLERISYALRDLEPLDAILNNLVTSLPPRVFTEEYSSQFY